MVSAHPEHKDIREKDLLGLWTDCAKRPHKASIYVCGHKLDHKN